MTTTAGGRRRVPRACTRLHGSLKVNVVERRPNTTSSRRPEIAGCVSKYVVVLFLSEVLKGWGAGGCQLRRGRIRLHRAQGGKRIMLNLPVTNLHRSIRGKARRPGARLSGRRARETPTAKVLHVIDPQRPGLRLRCKPRRNRRSLDRRPFRPASHALLSPAAR